MKTRQGTDVDKRNLEHVFEQLGFNVDTHENLRAGVSHSVSLGKAQR